MLKKTRKGTRTSDSKLSASVEKSEVVAASPATTALNVRLGEIAFPEGVETLGEKANYLHGYFIEASKRANGAAIMAGWILSVARSTCAHGQWYAWLEQNVSFGRTTAQNYMNLYAQTLGAARAAARRPIALEVEPTVAEIEAAAHDLDGKNMSQLYKSTRLIAASGDWGGKRENAGRKSKANDEAEEVSAQLDAVVNSPALLIAAIREPLATVYKSWRERDVFARIDLKDLGQVAATLKELANAANDALKARSKE